MPDKMIELLLYIARTTLCLGSFYLLYRILLNRESFFGLNRGYLLATLLVSVIIPLIPPGSLHGLNSEMPAIRINLDMSGQRPLQAGQDLNGPIPGHTWADLLLIPYIAISLLVLARMAVQSVRLERIMKESGFVRKGKIRLVYTSRTEHPFSWFRSIFINVDSRGSEDLDDILEHEQAHIRHMHFIDLLACETVLAILWLNPFVWLYSKAIREVHEYQADRSVLAHRDGPDDYISLLVRQATGTNGFRMANTFSQSLTKKRTIMMTKKSSQGLSVLKSLVAVPVMILLVLIFANGRPVPVQPDVPFTVTGMVLENDSKEPLPGTSIIIKGTTRGTVSDRDGKYLLKIDREDAVLVYSFVGYETREVNADREKIDVEMSQKIHKLDPDKVTRTTKYMGGASSQDDQVEKDEPDGSKVFYVVEDMPQFTGGEKGKGDLAETLGDYFRQNMRYPEMARQMNLEGKVVVDFTVDAKGKIRDAAVVNSSNDLFDAETLRLIRDMPDWVPGKQRGKPVSVRFTCPVEFRLN